MCDSSEVFEHAVVAFHAILASSASAGGAACLAIFLILVTKSYKRFVHRINLYLAVSSLLTGVITCVNVVPLSYTETGIHLKAAYEWKTVCSLLGFLVTNTTVMQYMCVTWITVYIFFLAVFKIQLNRCRHEILGVIVIFFCPFLFTWIPFIHDSYGLSVLWCWIDVCNGTATGTAYESIYLGFVFLLTVLNLVLLLSVVVLLCKGYFQTQLQLQHKKALKEMLPLAVMVIMSNVFVLLPLGCHIAYITEVAKKPKFYLWMTDIICVHIFWILLPLVFIFHPQTVLRIKALFKKNTQWSVTHYASIGSTRPNMLSVSEDAAEVLLHA